MIMQNKFVAMQLPLPHFTSKIIVCIHDETPEMPGSLYRTKPLPNRTFVVFDPWKNLEI